jgi:hypothetical protein
MAADPASGASSAPEPSQGAALKGAIIEAFFVVLGVVLAFAVNEWRSARHDAERAQVALESILEELETNRQAAKDSSVYHGRLIAELRSFEAENPEGVPPIRMFDQGFVSPAYPLTTAWDAATATNAITHLAYEDVLLLSRVYADQARYGQQAVMVGEVLYRRLFDEGREGIQNNYRNLMGIIGTFYFREKQLIQVYDNALRALGREVRDPDPEPEEAPAAGAPPDS